MHTLLLVLIAVVLASFGQIAMRHGMGLVGPLGSPGLDLVLNLIKAVFTRFVFLGIGLYAVSAMFWLMVLKQAKELSYVYPLIACTYIIVMFLSWLFFQERITLVRSAGVVLICIGVVFVARS